MKKWQVILSWVVYGLGVGWWGFGIEGWRFVVGSLVAGGLILADKLIYAWWLYPFEQSSIQIQYWTRKKDGGAVWGLLTGNKLNQQKLLLKSVGFALVWILLAIFIMSSTDSVVARGIVMGLGFYLGMNIARDWKNPSRLGLWFCWQIKRPVSVKEVRWYGGIFIAIWLMFLVKLVG